MLLDNFRLLDLTEYQGRRRNYVQSSGVIKNLHNSIDYEEFTIESSSLQPINGRTLQALPEAYRSKAQYTFWTKTDIRSLEQGTNQLSDQILIDGKWFSIYSLRDWTRTSFLIHCQCAAILDDQSSEFDYSEDGGNYG